MFERIKELGYQVRFENHAQAILEGDFAGAAEELEEVLLPFRVYTSELLGRGGGVTNMTQRLRTSLYNSGWRKHNFQVTKTVDEKEIESSSHEVDHVKKFDNGTLALEIEWNTKDTFYDRDFENFKRLHIDSAISVGIIFTRGQSFHESLRNEVYEYCVENGINSFEVVDALKIERTNRQRAMTQDYLNKGRSFEDAFSRSFVSDKYGEATTHWKKAMEKLKRGAGGSCPIILVGWPKEILLRSGGPK